MRRIGTLNHLPSASADQLDRAGRFCRKRSGLQETLGKFHPMSLAGLTLSGQVKDAADVASIGLDAAQRQGNSTEIVNLRVHFTFWALRHLRQLDARTSVELADGPAQPLDTTALIMSMSARTAIDTDGGQWQRVCEYARRGAINMPGAKPLFD